MKILSFATCVLLALSVPALGQSVIYSTGGAMVAVPSRPVVQQKDPDVAGLFGPMVARLDDCLMKTSNAKRDMKQCRKAVLADCDPGEQVEQEQCYTRLVSGLHDLAMLRIAGEQPSGQLDLGAPSQDNSDFRKRLAKAALRRAERIGQAECDFKYDTAPLPPNGSPARCYALRSVAAYWYIIAHRQYYFRTSG